MPSPEPEDAARLRAIAQAVRDLGGASPTVLDLGAGTGVIAAELASLGCTVVAVEGRARNAAAARREVEAKGVADRVEVIESDVRNLDWDALGTFDVVLCSGLLYHLRLPEAVALAGAMQTACRRLTLIDTEVAWGPLERRIAGGRAYDGIIFREHAPGSSSAEREASPLASLDNETSFWLTRASLHALLEDAGYSSSWELGSPAQPRRDARATVAALPFARVDDRASAGPRRPAEPPPGRAVRLLLLRERIRRAGDRLRTR